jgi:hypothetical protein
LGQYVNFWLKDKGLEISGRNPIATYLQVTKMLNESLTDVSERIIMVATRAA